MKSWWNVLFSRNRMARGGSRRIRERVRLREAIGVEHLEDRTLLAAGDLDITFGGGDGIVETDIVTDINYSLDKGSSVAVDAGGNYVVSGSTYNGSDQDFTLARYTSLGVLDTTFGGGDGIVITDIGSYPDVANTVVVDANGNYVVAGYTSNEDGYDFALLRYTSLGVLDTMFGGGDGIVITDLGSSFNFANSVVVDATGNYVVAGSTLNGDEYDFVLLRYTSSGVLDTTFGDGDGIVTTAIGLFSDFGNSVAVDTAGNYVVAGRTYNGSDFDFALARYTSLGVLDTTFGDGDGIITTGIFSLNYDEATSVAIDAADNYIVAGLTFEGFNYDFALARYTSAGVSDTTFGGGDGIVTTALRSSNDNYNDYGYGVAVDWAGNYVVVGTTVRAGGISDVTTDFALARYTSAGMLDTTFGGGDGIVTTDNGTSGDEGYSVAVDAAGKYVVAGATLVDNAINGAFALLRYESGLAATLSATLNNGDLTITDVDGTGKNNQITVSRSGTDLVITEANEQIKFARAGSTLSNGGRTLSIPLSSVTSLTINGMGGSDTLTIDFSGGQAIPSGGITFNGGVGTSDVLEVTGGTGVFVEHSMTGASDGSVTFAGTVNYTGLESVADSLIVVNRYFTFNGGAETITLVDATEANTTIDSTLSASVTFANPSGLLTINAGSGNDTVTVTSVDTALKAFLVIDGDVGTDTVNLNGDITLDTGNSLQVSAEAITVGAGANLKTSGTGSITLTSDSIGINGTATIASNFPVTLKQQTNGQAINLEAGFSRIDAPAINVGNANSGAITIGAAIAFSHQTDLNLTGSIASVTGSLDLVGGTLTFVNGAGSSEITTLSGGTLKNLTVLAGNSFAMLYVLNSATLNGVTLGVDTTLLPGTSGSGNQVTVLNGLTLANNKTLRLDRSTVTTHPSEDSPDVGLNFSSAVDQTLGGTGTVELFSAVAGNPEFDDARVQKTNAGSLTIGSGITIRNASNSKVVTLGNASRPLILQGTVLAQSSDQTLYVIGSSVTNNGTLQANSGTLFIAPTTFSNAGVVVAAGGISTIAPTSWTNTGMVTAQDGGVVNSSTSPTNLSGGKLDGGAWQVQANSTLRLPSAITTNAATILLDGANSNIFVGSTGTTSALTNLATVDSAGRFTIQNGRNFTTSGVLNDAGILTVGPSSTLTLGGLLTVQNGGYVQGTGTVTGNSLTVQSGGTVAPGASPGILNTGSVTLASGSNFNIELNGKAVGTQYDQLNVTGAVTLNDANVNVTLGFTPADGDLFTIINNDGTDAIQGLATFKVGGVSIPDGGMFQVGTTLFVIDYTGGSNNNDVTLFVQNNVVPVFTSSATPSVPENTTNVVTLAATDADSDPITFTITGGDDSAKFEIVDESGSFVLRFKAANLPNFESPGSAAGSNVYVLTIAANDGHGGLASQNLTVSVTDVNEFNPTVSGGPFSLAENSANATVVGSVSGDDADATDGGFSYSITGGNTLGIFAINSSTGQITVANNTNLDREAISSVMLTVQISDNGPGTASTGSTTVTINVTDANEFNPTVSGGSFSLAENSANATVVGSVSGDDADATDGGFSYSITGGNSLDIFA
ncbi:MAG: beta strand repeat-containing protein, partial [Planctomycetaceae bacterium]